MSRLHDQGEQNIGNIYLRNAAQNTNLFLGLYTNATQPAQNAIMTGLTEVTGGGYTRTALPAADWTLQGAQTPEGGSRYDQPQRLWVFSAAVGNVAGYFITTTSTGTAGLLIATEHFPAVISVSIAGFELRITPRIELR